MCEPELMLCWWPHPELYWVMLQWSTCTSTFAGSLDVKRWQDFVVTGQNWMFWFAYWSTVSILAGILKKERKGVFNKKIHILSCLQFCVWKKALRTSYHGVPNSMSRTWANCEEVVLCLCGTLYCHMQLTAQS